MTAKTASIESRARDIALLSTVSSQPHVWEAMKLLVEMADEVERLRTRLASSSSALDDMRRWAETEIDARKRERDEVHAQLATVRAQADTLLAVNDEQEKEATVWRERFEQEQEERDANGHRLAAMTGARDEACDLLDGMMCGSESIARLRSIGSLIGQTRGGE
jgi:hypothetical protein